MRDLAVQASNGGAQDASSQKAADTEFQELAKELTDIAGKTQFGNTKLLDGSYAANLQIGANTGDQLSLTIDNGVATKGFSAADLGVGSDTLTAGTVAAGVTAAQTALTHIDAAITTVSTSRATLGATQNRLEHKINNLNVAVENVSASESRIRDTDMASEMMSFTRSQILSQAGTAMLAQANSAPQSVLKLLG